MEHGRLTNMDRANMMEMEHAYRMEIERANMMEMEHRRLQIECANMMEMERANMMEMEHQRVQMEYANRMEIARENKINMARAHMMEITQANMVEIKHQRMQMEHVNMMEIQHQKMQMEPERWKYIQRQVPSNMSRNTIKLGLTSIKLKKNTLIKHFKEFGENYASKSLKVEKIYLGEDPKKGFYAYVTFKNAEDVDACLQLDEDDDEKNCFTNHEIQGVLIPIKRAVKRRSLKKRKR